MIFTFLIKENKLLDLQAARFLSWKINCLALIESHIPLLALHVWVHLSLGEFVITLERALVKRGPAYTELSLFAQINHDGDLELVNNLGINLGKSRRNFNNLAR